MATLYEFSSEVVARPDYSAPDSLVRAGEAILAAGRLIAGWAAQEHVSSGGRRELIYLYLPGDVIGSCAQAEGVTRTVALTRVAVAIREETTMEMLAMENEFLRRQALRTAHKTAMQRVADLLLEIYTRLSFTNHAESATFDLPVTQEVLASLLGLSAVHLNRTLMRMRQENLIATKEHTITLLETDLLQQIADFEPIQLISPILSS